MGTPHRPSRAGCTYSPLVKRFFDDLAHDQYGVIFYTAAQYKDSPHTPYPQPMPHTPEDKQRAITRLRRIKGQAEALERAVEAGSDCAPILQQLAALRGAVHGLMADLLDSHVRETLAEKPAPSQQAIDETLALLRSYLK